MTKAQMLQIQQALIDAAGLLDVIKTEWEPEGCWSEWDAGVRSRITGSLEILAAQADTPAIQPQNVETSPMKLECPNCGSEIPDLPEGTTEHQARLALRAVILWYSESPIREIQMANAACGMRFPIKEIEAALIEPRCAPDRTDIAKAIAYDLENGSAHGARVATTPHLDNYHVHGHVNLLAIADAVLSLASPAKTESS